MKPKTIIAISALAATISMAAQDSQIKYGNMDQWITREIKESRVIGGNEKKLYEIGPTRTITGNEPYHPIGGSPWATSNVLARVHGITKTNTTVSPDAHPGHGSAAKLETHIENVKVLGIVNISVLAAGSIFLGEMVEPITSTKDGDKNLLWGVPYTFRPKALKYDYKTTIMDSPNRQKITGFGKRGTIPGKDCAKTILTLQRRHEDAQGNITAERVGTLVILYDKSTPGWVEGATYEIHYGDITGESFYDAATMGLSQNEYARNSKGKIVPIKETAWAAPGTTPTHLTLQFSSSHGGAYIGTPGNTFWIDNVSLVN